MRTKLRLLLIGAGLTGLLISWTLISQLRAGDGSFANVLAYAPFAIGVAGFIAGFLWIRKIVNDIGKV